MMEGKMIYLCVFVTSFGITCLGQDVTYHIDEELRNSTKIGNIGENSNLFTAIGGSDSSSLMFSFLTTGNQYSHYFRVGENSGDLYTNAKIDREVVCEFTEICMLVLQIAAKSDLGSFFRILKVHVFINDINDHSPVFEKSTLTLPISEEVLVGTSYAIDGARDRDTSPEFSLKQYELQSVDPDFTGNIPFSIQFSKHLDGSSIIRLYVTEPLDREVRDAYHLEITAFDGDIPPKQGRLPVFILVSDANDNQPQFDAPSYNCTVSEETEKGAVILQLNATDLDSDDNGKIKYKLSPHQSNEIFQKFSIREDTGEIILKEKIAYSPGKIYRIIVEAFDNPTDGQSLSSQTFVLVNIENTGNNAPKIVLNLLTQTDNAEVSESANIGKVVAFVEVVDHDEGKQGMASCIIQAIDFDIQRIDMNKYKIFVSQLLDYERYQTQTVTIHCQDNGKPPLPASASFNITILDKNDNAPMFDMTPYTKNVREDLPVSDFILQVSASDLDSGLNAKVHFEISERYAHRSFFYFENLPNNRANLRLNRSLDRDTLSSYVFPIYAIDEGENGEPSKTGTAMVNLHITDVNDEKPVFKKSPFTIVVLENLPADTPVGNVIATDKDLGINAQVEYKIHPDYRFKVPFVVFSNGNIKTNQELDRESQDRYEFLVIATDKGEEPQSSTGSVVVLVSDANDMYPEIRFPKPSNNTVFVLQSVKQWQVITRVLASDGDEIGTGNSRLRFDISERNDSQLFQINPNSGDVQITKSVDETYIGKLYKLNIVVSDYGKQTSKSTPTVLYIKIKSDNATKQEVDSDVLSNQNFLIAIIVGIVTVVLSLGILATICIIRRIDRERKEEQKRKNNNQIKIDPDLNERQVFDGSITVFSLPSEDSLLNEKKKKEVSFSLEDDVFSDDDLITKNGLDSSHRHFKPNLTFLSPSQKKVEDNHSETSGDTGTSDSGRGGSDEEIHTSMSQSPRDKMMDFTRPLPPISHQEIIPFSFKKGMALPYSSRDYSNRPDVINTDSIEMTRRDLDPHRHGLSTMAVHLPNDSLDRSRNKVVLLQTDSGIHSDTNSNEGDNTRDCMV